MTNAKAPAEQFSSENLCGEIQADDAERRDWYDLRQDLKIIRGPDRRDGTPSWVIHDPAAFCHFDIGWLEFEILSRWSSADADQIVESINRETTLDISLRDVSKVETFLKSNALLRQPGSSLAAMRSNAKAGTGRIWNGINSKLVFRKIPLFRPQNFLAAIGPATGVFFSSLFWKLVPLYLLGTLYLISREWSSFTHGIVSMINLEGFICLAIAIVVAKSLHEVAHGIATLRFGGEVPTMGVMLIVLWPLLYTETSAAWMISNRRKRVIIASAGIIAEALLAIFALSLWPFITEGAVRDALAFTATTLLMLTVAFNANPLMKFDGYFIVAELTRMDNLQPRALALLSARIKEFLTGHEDAQLEPGLPLSIRRKMLIYGLACALYRILLFTTIAYAIYIILPSFAAVPIAFSVLMAGLLSPFAKFIKNIGSELWHKGRGRDRARALTFAFAGLAVFFIPFQSTIMVPVVYSGGRLHHIYASAPGYVTEIQVKTNTLIAHNQLLLRLENPDNEIELAWELRRREILERLVTRSLTSDGLRHEFKVRRSEVNEISERIDGLRELGANRHLRAPNAGRIVDILEGLARNVWINTNAPLMEIITADEPQIAAYVNERELELIDLNATGNLWLAGKPFEAWQVRVVRIRREAIELLREPYLAENLGGPIRVRNMEAGELQPEEGIYKIELAINPGANRNELPDIKTMGFAKIGVPPKSLFQRFYKRGRAIWRREFG